MRQPAQQNHPSPEAVAPLRDAQTRRARRKRARKQRQVVSFFVTPFLLVGTVTGAYFGGRALRRAAGAERPILSKALPLAASLDQVAENGAASGRKNRTSLLSRDNDESAGTFQNVYALIKEHYVDELPTDHVLTGGAVRALLQSLNDPNSQFLEPEQRQIFENEGKGKYDGIGASLAVRARKQSGYTEYKLVVVSSLPGSSAEQVGLRAGDVITHVGGKWVLGYDPFLKASKLARKMQSGGDDASDAMVRQLNDAARAQTRGGIGLFAAQMALKGDETVLQAAHLPTDRATLTVQRAGVSAPLSFAVPFKAFAVTSVVSKPLAGGIAYLKINTLSDATPSAFQSALKNIPHTGGLVLDLRNNAGGLIESAQAVDAALPLFPTAGKSTAPFGYEIQGHTRSLIPLAEAAPKAQKPASTVPKLVVLVNEGTASSAESLAASLGERHGATLFGSAKRTFGDASVQTLYPLSDGSAFTLTTGQWLSSRKQSWAGRGLTPRFVLPPAPPAGASLSDPALAQAVVLLQASPTLAPVRHAVRSNRTAKGHRL